MKERASNIELLRGILMIMIVCVHVTGNGVLKPGESISIDNPNWIVANLLDSFFYCCVNSFVLISGFFGIKLSVKKYADLDFPVIIYTLGAALILEGIRGLHISYFLPTLYGKYWFLTQYFVLFLISPILNKFADSLKRREFKIFIGLSLCIFCIIPFISKYFYASDRGMDFVNFAIIYMIGRYIKKYNVTISKTKGLLGYFLVSSLIFVGVISMGYLLNQNYGWRNPLYAYNNILVIIQSVCLFMFFKELKFRSSFINYLAPSFFYVYIIHQSPAIHARLYTFLKCHDYYYSNYFILHTLGSVILVFMACVVIDIVCRRLILKKCLNYVSNKVGLIDTKIKRYIETEK